MIPMQTIKLVGVVAALFIGVVQSAGAASNYDPSLRWQTLKTAHFAVHFHDGLESLAPEVAALAERVHDELNPVFNWTPQRRTDIVLTDRVDYANGSATTFPANRMTIIVSPPDEVRALEDYADHLRQLIRHEYVHVLHLDKAAGLTSIARRVLGRNPYLFPNAYQPAWFIEGLATYLEAETQTPYGRRQSSLFRMLMRLEVDAGIKPLRQVNQPLASWPGGASRYLYGVYFYQFVAERYGEAKIRELVDAYSRQIIPFLVNTTSGQVFGKNLTALWAEFEDYLNERFQPEITAIRTQGLQAGERVTSTAYFTGHPRVMPNGDLYYIENDGHSRQRLMLLSAGRKTPTALAEIYGRRFDIHPQAGVLLVQLDFTNSTNYFADLYQIDPATRRLTRLTTGGRYRAATWSPDGRRIVAVHNAQGNNSLHLLDSHGRLLDTLWQGARHEVVGQPDWSPDGKSLAAAVWRPESDWNLELFSIKAHRWRPLTHTAEIETDPQFSADGKSIVFSADYGGVYNIHRLELGTDKLTRLTNLLGGGLLSSLTADGQVLYYTGAHGKGTDVYRLPLNRGDKLIAAAYTTPVNKPAVFEKTPFGANRFTSYAPESGLAPTWWLPFFQFTTRHAIASILTSGSDPLLRHGYALQLGYDVKNGLPVGDIVYTYDRWHPTINLSFSRYVLDYFVSGQFDRFRNADTLTLEAVYPFLSNRSQWRFHTAALFSRESDAQPNVSPLASANDHTLGLALTFNSAGRYPFSVSRNDGRKVRLVAEDSDLLGGDVPGQAYTLDWSEYVRLGGEHVLLVRGVAGRGTGSQTFQLGGSDTAFSVVLPSFSTSSSAALFNRRRYGLRGYPAGLAGLSGSQMVLGELEWRFLLARVERGFMAPPIGLHQVQGKLIVNAGTAWSTGSAVPSPSRGGGAEIEAIMAAGYALPVGLRLGIAQGFDAGGELQAYFLLQFAL